MNSCELVSLVTALSCGIAKCYSKEELPLIIAILTQLADTLTTILAADELNSPRENAPSEGLNPAAVIISKDLESGSPVTANPIYTQSV